MAVSAALGPGPGGGQQAQTEQEKHWLSRAKRKGRGQSPEPRAQNPEPRTRGRAAGLLLRVTPGEPVSLLHRDQPALLEFTESGAAPTPALLPVGIHKALGVPASSFVTDTVDPQSSAQGLGGLGSGGLCSQCGGGLEESLGFAGLSFLTCTMGS